MQGILTAELNGQKESKTLQAVDSFDLTMAAISYILNKAANSELWAKGHIILKDRFGKVLKEMPAKV